MTNGTGSDVVGHFRTGFDALKRYPLLTLAPLAAHLLLLVLALLVWGGAVGMGAIMGAVMGGGPGAAAGGVAGFLAGGFLFVLLAGLLSLIASGVVVLMARDALAGREPALGDALEAVLARLLDVVVVAILVTLIVVIGLLFLVLPGVAAAFFLIFAMPAVLLDGQPAVDALRRSFTLVRDNLGVVAGLILGCILVAAATGVVVAILGHVPLVGGLAAAVVNGVVIAYLTVVAVDVYQTLPRRPRR